MFTSFAADSGIRYRAIFFDVKEDKTVERDVVGWIMQDNGAASAGVLVHEQGLIVPVQSFGNFLCVRLSGTEGLESVKHIIEAGIERIKAQAQPAASA